MKEIHEAALIIPPMKDDEYRALVEDIKENGLINPIKLIDGKIIDGRHRQMACDELGIEPDYEEVDPDSPMVYVVSANINRRMLTVGQKAMLALPIEEQFAKEALERQSRRAHEHRSLGAKAGNRPVFGKLSKPKQTQQENVEARSITKAGKLLGVGASTVQKAKKVHQEAPELAEMVKTGTMTMQAAYDQTMLREGRGRLAPKKSKPAGGTGPLPRFARDISQLEVTIKKLTKRYQALEVDEMWRAKYGVRLHKAQEELGYLHALVTNPRSGNGDR